MVNTARVSERRQKCRLWPLSDRAARRQRRAREGRREGLRVVVGFTISSFIAAALGGAAFTRHVALVRKVLIGISRSKSSAWPYCVSRTTPADASVLKRLIMH